MKIDQIALVEQSFDQVKPIAPRAAVMFYERLFELDPSLRPLFRGDLARQGQMLMAMIAGAVNGLRNIPQLTPVLRQLGARHVAYGVEDAHYATVGKALLWTLEQGLGDAFTIAYGLLAGTMQEGAREAVAA